MDIRALERGCFDGQGLVELFCLKYTPLSDRALASSKAMELNDTIGAAIQGWIKH